MVPSCATIIDECLPLMTEAELRDIIRVSQRLVESKIQQVRNGKRQWRFWDKPLELDWSGSGVPAVPYPRSRQEPEIDVFELLKGSASEPMSATDWKIFALLAPMKVKGEEEVDWDLLQLLDPSQDKRWEIAEPEEEPEVNWLAVDWSGDRLPHLKYTGPPRRRPGFAGRVRTGWYHKSIKPRSRRDSPQADQANNLTKSDLVKLMLARYVPEPIKRPPPTPQRNPWSMSRMAPRIKQPCGGGR
jgi:hypothetical protein